MRVDLHVHSRFSQHPSQWFLKKIRCPESFTDPLHIYQTARQSGMSLVTIADHNTIEGALEIAHLPDTFLSEEITAYFPEDRCKVHVLAFAISEAQHQECRKLRMNLYDLVAYLNQYGICHALAHPLYAVNDKLSLWHFERLLLLFRNFELNGARNPRLNAIITRVLAGLTAAELARLEERHQLPAAVPEPWRKHVVGGSDDHSGLTIARTFTAVDGADSIAAFFAGIENRRAQVHGVAATPATMAHNLYGIAYQYYKQRFDLGRYARKDLLIHFLDQLLDPQRPQSEGLVSRIYHFWQYRRRPKNPAVGAPSLVAQIKAETRRLIQKNPDLFLPATPAAEERRPLETTWQRFVNQVSNALVCQSADHLMNHLAGANLFRIFQTLGSAGGLYTLMAPYFLAYAHFTKDRCLGQAVERRFGIMPDTPADAGREKAVVQFTDTFYDVNGVALTLQQQVAMARRQGRPLTVITCDNGPHAVREGVCNFKPVRVYDLPEYPQQKLHLPPFLDLLDYCYENHFDQIHSATPGPVGLAALAIARILKLPISGTYHTAFPQYARFLTGDDALEDLTWKFTLWYYDQMDVIYAPSKNTKAELVQRGIKEDKIRVYPRGIDVQKFHPAKRNGFLRRRFQIDHRIVLLSVGRVSREKNLHLLAQAFQTLASQNAGVCLLVVGDGPYLEEMKRATRGLPCFFSGYLTGEELACAYASSDIFVFPSTTDTFGNVVMEAQASGLPVIVTDEGGPCENLLPGETGLMVPGGDVGALTGAMLKLAANPEQTARMGRAARRYMAARSFDAAFDQTWRLYQQAPAAHNAAA
ncbi:MAG: glycosyltransferase [Desulfobacterales bacterium]